MKVGLAVNSDYIYSGSDKYPLRLSLMSKNLSANIVNSIAERCKDFACDDKMPASKNRKYDMDRLVKSNNESSRGNVGYSPGSLYGESHWTWLRSVKGKLTAIKDPIQFVQRTAICAKLSLRIIKIWVWYAISSNLRFSKSVRIQFFDCWILSSFRFLRFSHSYNQC